jgi:hypothetical protein
MLICIASCLQFFLKFKLADAHNCIHFTITIQHASGHMFRAPLVVHLQGEHNCSNQLLNQMHFSLLIYSHNLYCKYFEQINCLSSDGSHCVQCVVFIVLKIC